MLNLTIAIPAKNEEKNILSCLEGIGKSFAEEIVLLDSNSQDKTVELAEKWGARIISFHWNGQFPKKRNWYLRNFSPQTDWILFLDADEILTDQFKKELVEKLLNPDGRVGFWLSYTRYFMGKKLVGGYSLRKLALFKVGSGEYEYIKEDSWSTLDMEVHEHPILNGPVGVIKAEIEHNDFRGIEHYQKKHLEYAKWEAKRLLYISDDQNFTLKQKIKYKLIKSSFGGIFFFIVSYFLLGGFLDGKRGLLFAIFKLNYFSTIRALLLEEKSRL